MNEFIHGSCQYLQKNRKQTEVVCFSWGKLFPSRWTQNWLCHEMSNANVYTTTTEKCCQKFVRVVVCLMEAKITPTRLKVENFAAFVLLFWNFLSLTLSSFVCSTYCLKNIISHRIHRLLTYILISCNATCCTIRYHTQYIISTINFILY